MILIDANGLSVNTKLWRSREFVLNMTFISWKILLIGNNKGYKKKLNWSLLWLHFHQLITILLVWGISTGYSFGIMISINNIKND